MIGEGRASFPLKLRPLLALTQATVRDRAVSVSLWTQDLNVPAGLGAVVFLMVSTPSSGPACFYGKA